MLYNHFIIKKYFKNCVCLCPVSYVLFVCICFFLAALSTKFPLVGRLKDYFILCYLCCSSQSWTIYVKAAPFAMIHGEGLVAYAQSSQYGYTKFKWANKWMPYTWRTWDKETEKPVTCNIVPLFIFVISSPKLMKFQSLSYSFQR